MLRSRLCAAREFHREGQEEIVRALLSVANREGIADLARALNSLGVELYATDGTRAALAEDGVECHAVSELTGSETLAGGQVKTFHATVYAGILAHRNVPGELAELSRARHRTHRPRRRQRQAVRARRLANAPSPSTRRSR